MIIDDTSEKSKSTAGSQAFVPLTIILLILLGFGSWKLSKLSAAEPAITITTNLELVSNAGSGPSASQTSKNSVQATSTPAAKSGAYVGSRGGTSYYLPTCAGAKRLSEKNKIYFESREEAERLGYKPAKNCKF